MTIFRHQGKRQSVGPGETWAAPTAAGETYHDTPANELREIVREVSAGEPWRDCVRRHYAQRNPWLHRIIADPSRDLFFRNHPPRPGSRILDIGAGWGQISLPLTRGNTVVALEPTPERLAFIQAAARQDGVADRITCLQSDFMEIDFETPFDLVCCIGVLEWVPKFRPDRDPIDAQRGFLRHLHGRLSKDGECIVGIENRLGLKYLLGANDDHTGLPGISCLDAATAARRYQARTHQPLRVFTHTLGEYAGLFAEAGFSRIEFFAAFPDYKVPQLILPIADGSVDRHCLAGAFIPEHDGCNGATLSFQEELASHYRSLAASGTAGLFAPSFYIRARC